MPTLQQLNNFLEAVREYGVSIGINEALIFTFFLIVATTLLRSKIKDISVSIDNKLYDVSRNRGKAVRTLIYPIRFILPSNPLRGYIDYQTATRLENDNIIDLSTVSPTNHSDNPTRHWRLGFKLQAVMARLSVNRRTADSNSVTNEIITELDTEKGLIVVGRPGSGKSTICKQVACEWYQQELGPVLYRESNQGQITDKAALKETIEKTPPDQTLLIVIEDICSPEHIELVEPLIEHRQENIRYLFDSKTTALENLLETQTFDTIQSKQTASALTSEFVQYPTPNLSPEECQRIIDKYEETTGKQVVESADSIHQRVENSGDIGQMLMLIYEISSDSSELEDKGLTGLELDVQNKYNQISKPATQGTELGLDQYDPDLLYEIAFSINAYNVANIPLAEKCLLNLDDDHNEIRRIIDSLEGWLLFENESTGQFETYHELWSVYYLRQVLKDRSDNAHNLFTESINAFLNLLDTDTEIETPDIDGLASYKLSDLAYGTLLYIYQNGRNWPAISELFTELDIDDLNIPEEFRPELDAELAAERSITLLYTGLYDRAEDELDKYYDIATEVDHIDQDELEAFYGHSLAHIYIESGRYPEAEEILSELLDGFENGGLSKGYVLSLYGIVKLQEGAFGEAIDILEEGVEIAQNNEDQGLEQNCLLNIGIALERGSKHEQAQEYYEQSVELAEQTGNNLQIARSNHNLGQLLFTRSEIEDDYSNISEAISKLEYSYRIKKDLGDEIGQATTLSSLANIYHATGDLNTAEEYFEKAQPTIEQADNKDLQATYYHNYSLLLRDRGKIDEAENHLLASLELHNDTGNVVEKFRTLDILVALYLTKADLEAAADHAISGVELCIEAGDLLSVIDILQFIISLSGVTKELHEKMNLRIVALTYLAYVSNMGPPSTTP